MRNAFIALHVSILLAGWTGVFGRMIDLSAVMIVWWRCVFAGLLLFAAVKLTHRLQKVSFEEARRFFLLGVFLAFQWMLFYAAIKASNVSIGVVTFSTIGFFTAIFEPLILKSRFSLRELGFSLLTMAGIALIFGFDARYRLGIFYGVLSAAGAALIAIFMKSFRRSKNGETVLTWQLAGAFAGATLMLPVFFHFSPEAHFAPPTWADAAALVFFATVITLGMYLLQMAALKRISAFTMNLSYNLEPIYSILIAMVLFDEAQDLNLSFWAGLGLIALSVVVQTVLIARSRPQAG